MLIVSKFKDYYDGVANSKGIDKTIVYKRKTVKLTDNEDVDIFKYKHLNNENNKPNFYKHYDLNEKSKYIKYHYFVVGFCNEFYLGIKFVYKTKLDQEKFDVFYDRNQIINNLKTKGKYSFSTPTKEKLTSQIKNILDYKNLELFRKHNTPVILYDSEFNELIINPNLKNYEFYKIIDTFQTFQKIEMFISGILGNKEKEIINVDDKYKIQQHGFDLKWSFRKKPKKKK